MKRSILAAASLLAAFTAQAVEPQVHAMFRVLKADGQTVVGQALITPAGSSFATINVRQADAIVMANGRCAFNVKYDEVSTTTQTNTTNRLYSNDTLVAQNTKIDLKANELRSIMTQPYLYAGQNNVKVVINADSASPTIGWVRVNVDGTCSATPKPTTPPPVATPKPPAPAPVIQPGSADWNNLYNAWGYSNYAVTQLKGKGYAKYADLTKVNADLSATVAAKRVEQAAYAALMARWNAIANDPAFKAAMARITPTGGK